MNRSAISIAGLVLAVILFIAVNVLSNNMLGSARLDLTQNGLYTLSDGTRSIIGSVKEPIHLRLYFSQKLANRVPQLKAYEGRVRELLEQYVNLSHGKIRLEVVEPEPFSDEEDAAVRAGLKAVPLSDEGDNLYFGLVGRNTVDDEETIPFFSQDREAFLEYDLTKLIYQLTDPKKPVVGLYTGQQMNASVSPMMARFNGGQQPWAIVNMIRDTFTLKEIDPNKAAIPDDVDVLLLVHPTKLSDDALYRIDQFVLNGGRVVAYVDPYSEVAAAAAARRRMPPGMGASSDLQTLFKAWGISVDPAKIVGDFKSARQVNAGYPGGAPKIVRYLPWLKLDDGRLNRDDVITSQLGPITMASAGSIDTLKDAKVTVEPLITTSKDSDLINVSDVQYGPDPDALLKAFKPSGKDYVLAARVRGQVPTAFPDGPPKPEPKKAGDKAGDNGAGAKKPESPDKPAAPAFDPARQLKQSKGPINVIVVADSDTLYDQFWLNKQDFMGQSLTVPTASNGDFLINALDNMAGSSELIGLRSRGLSSRPFLVVDNLRRQAEQKFHKREQELQDKLEKTQQKISELQSRAKAGGGALLSAEQQSAIQDAREQVVKTRKQLRGVQHDLNKDIEGLEARLKFANIGLIPILVFLIAIVLAGVRYQRRRRRTHTKLN